MGIGSLVAVQSLAGKDEQEMRSRDVKTLGINTEVKTRLPGIPTFDPVLFDKKAEQRGLNGGGKRRSRNHPECSEGPITGGGLGT